MNYETKNNLIVCGVIVGSMLIVMGAIGYELLKVAALIKWVLM